MKFQKRENVIEGITQPNVTFTQTRLMMLLDKKSETK